MLAIIREITSGEPCGNANATRRSSNGTEDVGATQANSVHFETLRKYGIRRDDLLDACTSVYVGAWLYAKKVRKYGNTWTAVGAYHSETPHLRDAYANRIKRWIDEWAREGRLQ